MILFLCVFWIWMVGSRYMMSGLTTWSIGLIPSWFDKWDLSTLYFVHHINNQIATLPKITTAAIANRFVRTWVWNRILFKNFMKCKTPLGWIILQLLGLYPSNQFLEKSADHLLDHLIFKESQTEDTFGTDRPFNHFYCSLWATCINVFHEFTAILPSLQPFLCLHEDTVYNLHSLQFICDTPFRFMPFYL